MTITTFLLVVSFASIALSIYNFIHIKLSLKEFTKNSDEVILGIRKELFDICESVASFVRIEKAVLANKAMSDTIVEMMCRNALTEAVANNQATLNSPMILDDEIRSYFKNIDSDLKEFYRKDGHDLTPNDLFMEIGRRFGLIIENEICIPHKMKSDVAILFAAKLASEPSSYAGRTE